MALDYTVDLLNERILRSANADVDEKTAILHAKRARNQLVHTARTLQKHIREGEYTTGNPLKDWAIQHYGDEYALAAERVAELQRRVNSFSGHRFCLEYTVSTARLCTCGSFHDTCRRELWLGTATELVIDAGELILRTRGDLLQIVTTEHEPTLALNPQSPVGIYGGFTTAIRYNGKRFDTRNSPLEEEHYVINTKRLRIKHAFQLTFDRQAQRLFLTSVQSYATLPHKPNLHASPKELHRALLRVREGKLS